MTKYLVKAVKHATDENISHRGETMVLYVGKGGKCCYQSLEPLNLTPWATKASAENYIREIIEWEKEYGGHWETKWEVVEVEA